MERVGDWMQTYQGVAFYPLDPKEEEINIEDIAHALSLTCRYGGHCNKFYSVAEHCILASYLASEELKLTTLMHDASEAYLADVVRPIKRHLTNYLSIEKILEEMIAKKFGLQFPYPEQVKKIDNTMLLIERDQNMVVPPQSWILVGETIEADIELKFWSPTEAEHEFLLAFHRYGGKHD